jgi:hypothetical protein
VELGEAGDDHRMARGGPFIGARRGRSATATAMRAPAPRRFGSSLEDGGSVQRGLGGAERVRAESGELGRARSTGLVDGSGKQGAGAAVSARCRGRERVGLVLGGRRRREGPVRHD